MVSLRDFIRHALDLDPIPVHLPIPRQGPLRPPATRGKGEGGRDIAVGVVVAWDRPPARFPAMTRIVMGRDFGCV